MDSQELRFALLFWDKLIWPGSNLMHFESGPDEMFLEECGVLSRPMYSTNGDQAQAIIQGQIQAFNDCEKNEPGAWSLSQGQNSLLIRANILSVGNGAYVELHRAIPVPDKDVPLDDVLQFRTRRHDELGLVRDELDQFTSTINASPDKKAALDDHVKRVDRACSDAIKAGREWKFPVRLANIKASLDLRPFTTLSASAIGWKAGATHHLGLATAVLCGAGASIKWGADFVPPRMQPRQSPYRYVSRFHDELF